MNRNLMRQAGFQDAVKAVELGECPFCHIKVNIMDFKDELSRKEFSMSGLCQSCQDDVFKEEE